MLNRILTLLVTSVVLSTALQAQLVGVTFLNNSPDAALAKADIYISQSGGTQKGEDVSYQDASNLESIFIFSDLETTVSVAPGSSSGEGEKVVSKTFTPAFGAAYMIIVSGVGTPGDYAPNPDGKSTAYTISIFETPAFTGNPNEIGTLVYNGSTDQNSCDFRVRGRQAPVLADASFTENTAANVNLARETAVFDITAPGKASEVFGSFEVGLSGYSSEVVVLALSGFKTPDDNKNGPGLVLLAVLESGSVVRNELITGSQTASVQIIHNAADPQAGIIDIWINGKAGLENIGFRKASGFMEMPAGEPVVIGFAPATSKTYADTIKTVTIPALRPGRSYHFIAHGVIDTAGFAKNPGQRDIGLTIHVAEGAQTESLTDGKTEVRTAHGVTDAGELIVRSSAGVTFANGSLYSDISATYLAVTPATDTLWVIDPETDKPVKGWVANLTGNKRATVLLASGFADPAANNNGERFRLILVDANGNVVANMQEVDPPTVSVEEDVFFGSITAYPNPASTVLNISVGDHASAITGVQIVSVDGTSVVVPVDASASEAISIPVNTLSNGVYYVRLIGASAPSATGMRVLIQR